jgi:flagellar protein FlaG
VFFLKEVVIMDIHSIGKVAQPASTPTERSNPEPQSAIAAKAVAAQLQVATAPVAKQAAPEPSPEQVAEAVKNLNKSFKQSNNGLEFSIDADSHQTIVKVVDIATNEVIRQIPSKDMMEMAKALESAQHGLLIQQKA